jgi:threonine aldolase
VFYIGGTKAGTLCGEAVVFTKGNTPSHFLNRIKKRGALLAKGRLLGAQFDALFTDDLFCEIGKHAIDMAEKLKEIFTRKGYSFFLDSPTNQQFVILDKATLERLRQNVAFSVWEWLDADHAVVRFATAWSTTQEDLDQLEQYL